MAVLQWDRLLETCLRRNASDLLLSPGTPPMIRLAKSWRALQAPLVDIIALRALANEQLAPNPVGEGDGYAYSDLRFGGAARFRVMAFGYPATSLLLVARDPPGGSAGDAFAPAV